MHVLTFDIEEWFRIFSKFNGQNPDKIAWPSSGFERNIDKICQFLNKRKVKATFFWLGWEAKRNPELVRRISDQGHEIGVHSYYHSRLDEIKKREFRENTSRAIQQLQEITGQKVKAYRAPGLSINKKTLWAFKTLIDLGIEMDSSLVTGQPIGRHRVSHQPFIVDYKGIKMKEFPISSFSMLNHSFNYAGSGYFRITPSWFLQKKMEESSYTMSYFHPRDFDLNIHKMIAWNPYLQLKYRLGTKKAFDKLLKLSEKNHWISIGEASSQINWEETRSMPLL